MYTKPMALDSTLAQDLGGSVHPFALTNPDMFGVEVELEGRNITTEAKEVRAFWAVHKDGSLRAMKPGDQAIEYVFLQPLNLTTTLEASKSLFKFLNSEGVTVYPSYRTSIHVHLNCAAEKMRTIYNLIALSIVFDELFVSQNGEHRIGNNFCLRARDAQGQLTQMVDSLCNHGHLYNCNGNNRYSSVNFMSLMKFGTVEFRSLECTTDYPRLQHWIETLQRLKVAARTFETPQDIVRYYSRMSTVEFLYYILGDKAAKYAKVPNYHSMLHDGMRLAQDFAFCSKWITKNAQAVKSEEALAKKKQAVKKLNAWPHGPLGQPAHAPPGWGHHPLKPVGAGGAGINQVVAAAGAGPQPIDHHMHMQLIENAAMAQAQQMLQLAQAHHAHDVQFLGDEPVWGPDGVED